MTQENETPAVEVAPESAPVVEAPVEPQPEVPAVEVEETLEQDAEQVEEEAHGDF